MDLPTNMHNTNLQNTVRLPESNKYTYAPGRGIGLSYRQHVCLKRTFKVTSTFQTFIFVTKVSPTHDRSSHVGCICGVSELSGSHSGHNKRADQLRYTNQSRQEPRKTIWYDICQVGPKSQLRLKRLSTQPNWTSIEVGSELYSATLVLL